MMPKKRYLEMGEAVKPEASIAADMMIGLGRIRLQLELELEKKRETGESEWNSKAMM